MAELEIKHRWRDDGLGPKLVTIAFVDRRDSYGLKENVGQVEVTPLLESFSDELRLSIEHDAEKLVKQIAVAVTGQYTKEI